MGIRMVDTDQNESDRFSLRPWKTMRRNSGMNISAMPVGASLNCGSAWRPCCAGTNNPTNLLDDPGAAPVAPSRPPIGEGPGTLIGPYKLLEQIGEGGFGVVFMAEQQQPVRRKVALKIIKPGMDTRQVVARFEAERQALALMDHPNIARDL